ncbi:RICIN domain-containing protein [Clostridium frigidicarnis]|uniref:Ricin-type beta-trefoil lectin domain-containing protein n=1 Tax=Clostridium frigidicarnis TaxID=84698 RepID=A0A1I1AU65_9CLOT|nr:ricin-type beta-trefoil lectin domain protein [Clostridium frigidicarnis]SFB41584.1 Ricin-type beta-trefoil lectin domain-containing protein [Clostridium frigidicarnis]
MDNCSGSKYLIAYSNNLNYCITAKTVGSGSQVVLYHVTGIGNARQQWIFDETNQVIRSAADENLVLSIQGSPISLTPIIISSYIPGNTAQQWDWTSKLGSIKNVAYPQFMIDNKCQVVADNNPIILYAENPTAAQVWTFVKLSHDEVNTPMMA